MVRMVFHDIFVDRGPLGAALGVCFNVNVRHDLLSLADEGKITRSVRRRSAARPWFHWVAVAVNCAIGRSGAGVLGWPPCG
jgi:hypothetical protein